MLTQEEIEDMREDFIDSLPDQALLIRTSQVDDGQGGTIPGDPETIYDGPCRLSPSQGRNEATDGSQLVAVTGWYITLQAQVTVYEKDTIEVRLLEDGEVIETRVFEISGVMDSRTYQIGTRIMAVEID